MTYHTDGSAFVRYDKRFAVAPWQSLSFLPSVPVGRWGYGEAPAAVGDSRQGQSAGFALWKELSADTFGGLWRALVYSREQR